MSMTVFKNRGPLSHWPLGLMRVAQGGCLAIVLAVPTAAQACDGANCGPMVLPSIPAQTQLRRPSVRPALPPASPAPAVLASATAPAGPVANPAGEPSAAPSPAAGGQRLRRPKVQAAEPAQPAREVATAVPEEPKSPAAETTAAVKPKVKAAKAAAPAAVVDPPAEGAPGIAGFKTDLEALKPMEIKVTPKPGVPTTLAGAVRTAISDNALIKVSEGSSLDALAGIGVAEVGLYPQVDGRLGTGISGTGDWQQTKNRPYFDRKVAYGAGRGDVSLSAQQTLFDFGATRSGIEKAAAFTEAQNFSVLQTVEDVAFKTADNYLKVLQSRELVDLSTENLDSLKEIADLVSENQKNGNGTVADVKRVSARVIDAASIKADETLALKLASDQLRRLIRTDPGRLSPAPSLGPVLPSNEGTALSLAEGTNPGIRAYKASIQSREAEIASIRSGRLPKVTAEVSASNRQYQAVNDKTVLDASAMLGLTYKFYDGGLASAQIEQVRARMLQDEMRMRDLRETIEADLRQNYFTIKIARDKSRSLAEAVDLNSKARTLYREQFRGGKRSLLELLEVQQAYYLSKRSLITNQFDEQRASYQILRSLGRFAVAALRTR